MSVQTEASAPHDVSRGADDGAPGPQGFGGFGGWVQAVCLSETHWHLD